MVFDLIVAGGLKFAVGFLITLVGLRKFRIFGIAAIAGAVAGGVVLASVL